MPKNPFGLERLGGFTSHAIREARKVRRSGPFKKLCKKYEHNLSSQPQTDIFQTADPNAFYRVGGETVPGSKFPGGVKPFNATKIPEEDIPQEIDP